MKTIAILLSCIPFFASSQTETPKNTPSIFNDDNFQVHRNFLIFEGHLLGIWEDAQVKTVEKTFTSKNGKHIKKSTYVFNEQFKPSKIITENYQINIDYYNDSLYSKIEFQGKQPMQTNFTYVDDKLVLKETFREDKLIGRTAHQYNEDGNMIFSSVNRAKKRKNYTMRYNYDGNKVVNQRYTKNNKIVREWDFRCKPEGETEESKVKSTVCEFSKENADGSYVKFERHERDGKLFLVKEFYTSDDALYKSQGYKNESMLAWENLYEGKNVHHKSYDKKGQVDYWDISVFNDEGKIISYSTSWNGKDRSVSEALYSYNEDGTLAEKKTTFKQKVTGITTFKYTK